MEDKVVRHERIVLEWSAVAQKVVLSLLVLLLVCKIFFYESSLVLKGIIDYTTVLTR